MIFMVSIGFLFFSISQASAESSEVSSALERALEEMKSQYDLNRISYERRQESLHESANELRDALCALGKIQHCYRGIKVDVTSYNPEEGQTDGSPCIGANSTDVCYLHSIGVRPVALTPELVSRNRDTPFHYGDKVKLVHSNPKCTGVFQVEDTTASYLSRRADIFSPRRSENVGKCLGALLLKP